MPLNPSAGSAKKSTTRCQWKRGRQKITATTFEKILLTCAVTCSTSIVALSKEVPLADLKQKMACYQSGKCECPTHKIPYLDVNATCGTAEKYSVEVSNCQNAVIAYNYLLLKYNQDVDECLKIGNRKGKEGPR